MGLKVVKIEDLLCHYEGVLHQSADAREVLIRWGLDGTAELREVRKMRAEMVNRLVSGDVEF